MTDRERRDEMRAYWKSVERSDFAAYDVLRLLDDADALEAERDLLAAKITAVEALVGRFEAAGISCHALGHYEREADYRSVVGAINDALALGVRNTEPGDGK